MRPESVHVSLRPCLSLYENQMPGWTNNQIGGEAIILEAMETEINVPGGEEHRKGGQSIGKASGKVGACKQVTGACGCPEYEVAFRHEKSLCTKLHFVTMNVTIPHPPNGKRLRQCLHT